MVHKLKIVRDTSKWAKPKTLHRINGVEQTFNEPITRAQALKRLGIVRKPKMKLSPFHIKTFMACDKTTIIDAPLKASIQELAKIG